MITDRDIYVAFRHAQAKAKDRPYKLPKNWDSFKAKMAVQNRQWLDESVVHFNTRLSNLNLDDYMDYGFELWKGFTYKQFLNPRLLEYYIQKDKVKKRKRDTSMKDIDRSVAFINEWMQDKPERPGYSVAQSYCKFRDGEAREVVRHYQHNRIDPLTFVYFIYKRYIVLSDFERAIVPYITGNFRELVQNMNEVIDYIEMTVEAL